MGSTEQQIIATLAGVLLTGFGAFCGRFVPIWWEKFRRWSRDRAELMVAHDAVAKQLAERTKEVEEMRASLTAAAQGSDLRHDLITGLQDQIDEMKRDFTVRLDDAVRYIVDLTAHILDGSTGPLPEPPASISDNVRAEIAERIEHKPRETPA